ncbi:hypothetical protein J2X01_001623 [Arthrobacter ginsengisoli]|uniref:Heavy metal transporter n=1 Tax=Arthrobacter ginsengisoli TaxID=1356565 RepID=A0ABU1UB48_9MICC|nr:hypothetical protein [Arthrobacter ginsengisoli]
MARRRKWRHRIVLLLTLAMVAGGIYTAVAFVQRSEVLITERCTAVGAGSAELATDQAANAGLISAVAVRRGLPARAASIALATAMQESKLRNIGHGDQAGPDSRGLFQQRPTQGWGTTEQVMDPYHASNAFYDALVKVAGYETLDITVAAQRVQRSAYPDAYAQHEAMARAFAASLTGQTAADLDCTLRDPDTAGDTAATQERLSEDFGVLPASTEGNTLVLDAEGTQAWAVAHWAVANAKALSITEVQTDGQSWTRQARNGWQSAEAPAGQVRVTVAEAPKA